jgi:dTDP-glucose 4,6-dehydratase
MAAERSEQAIGELINLGVGKGISIGDLVNTVGSLLGKKLEVASDAQRVRPAASEVSKLISDNSKARKLLDWSPEVSLTDGLQETIQFVQAHVESLRVADYVV